MTVNTHIPTGDEIDNMTDRQHRSVEARCRRAADRRGLRLEKARQRDPNGLLYGTYQLVDNDTSGVVLANWALQRGYGAHLSDVAEYLWADAS
jgi:hypothetical protein